jgi:transposase
MDEIERRRTAVRLRQEGHTTAAVAEQLGRSQRWVRKWTARQQAAEQGTDWALSHSRAPHTRPTETAQEVVDQVLAVRAKLEEDPRSQVGALAIAWELHLLGVDPVPQVWTINRILARAGVTKPRRRRPDGYRSKGAPYPTPPSGPGEFHQADMVGPRHLDGGIRFHALNLIDVGSHTVGTEILDPARPVLIAGGLVQIWHRVGLPTRIQFDNHATLRGAIPPQASIFGPVVATCLDLGVIARFAPLREPWRNGTIEHFNDVWDKSFFRTRRHADLDTLSERAAGFEDFHNARHRYSAHAGRAPDEITVGRQLVVPPAGYQPPVRLPAKGRIEAVRFIRSDGRLDLWGHRVRIAEEHTYQYVTAVIAVRAKTLTVVTRHGEIIHKGTFPIDRHLR